MGTIGAMLRVTVERVASVSEAAGMFTMVVGALLAAALAFRDRRGGGRAIFKGFRLRLGRAIILGLEFLVAADILRTISADPTLRGVAILGGIVLIRTFLSFSLEVELEGRWPWQAQALDGTPTDGQPDGERSRATP
jgi:uncharacterized membrane protein